MQGRLRQMLHSLERATGKNDELIAAVTSLKQHRKLGDYSLHTPWVLAPKHTLLPSTLHSIVGGAIGHAISSPMTKREQCA